MRAFRTCYLLHSTFHRLNERERKKLVTFFLSDQRKPRFGWMLTIFFFIYFHLEVGVSFSFSFFFSQLFCPLSVLCALCLALRMKCLRK